MQHTESTKAMHRGANAAIFSTEFTTALHEDAVDRAESPLPSKMAANLTGGPSPAFSAQGAVGKQFTPEGSVGGMAQKLGGPFDAKGAIGKQFTEQGSIGGMVQDGGSDGSGGGLRK
ncbi:uncharacterized protein K452DRAFT_317579 [Aplosporella prunicola CBS 121167]|uniref:Uncharacterized protein n=1 Tax=Aplosporella prunicola CBS 121167 TaxID=1176127 RepID=A0A6A6BH17_9PEZI|nr:uncharacterized protein K452DRAFT_317579 [Aplosporella prunicola CBS 121167]KAF2143439.1 hypothetical protein K452DRAFT_317579 [Aplosporella prunicola CBS 121167]